MASNPAVTRVAVEPSAHAVVGVPHVASFPGVASVKHLAGLTYLSYVLRA